MKITNTTTAKDLEDRTKEIMFLDKIPNMKLKDGTPCNPSYSSNENFKIWLDRLCNRI